MLSAERGGLFSCDVKHAPSFRHRAVAQRHEPARARSHQAAHNDLHILARALPRLGASRLHSSG